MRFPEFTDEWKKIRLSDNCNIVMGQSPSSKNYTKNSNDTILIQGNADLENGKIKPRLYTTEITKKSEKGDIILTVRAPVGDLAINEYSVCIGRGVCSIKSKNNIFIYYILENLKRKHIWERLSQGSTFESINSNDIENISFYNPSENEQNKISNFLSLIDRKIEYLEKRYIQNNKQFEYYLNMIMEEKLNFSKGNTEWVEYYIKDITFIPKKDKIKKFTSNDKLLTVKLHTKGIFINNNIKPKLTKKGRPYYKRYSDELLIGRQNFHNGGIGIVPNELNGGVCSNAISSFCVNKEKVLLKFLYYYLSRKNYYERCEKYVGGTGQKEFSEKQLLKLKIRIPKLEEQKNIIKFLDLISNRNKLIKNNLELLKQFKKGLLQKMFV